MAKYELVNKWCENMEIRVVQKFGMQQNLEELGNRLDL